MNAFATGTPATVNKVFFTGSVMPAKYLRMWQQALPGARFVNHYGPTEITASCTWAEVGHVVGDGERLPIGRPFRNTRILLLDDEGREVSAPGETGEICVAGCGLALGYFDDPGLTAKCFVQNPLHCAWPERIYRTGDYAHRDADGVLWFHGRRDSQIKFMGHRVEMEEIELAARALAGVEEACCFFEEDRERLHLFVQGEVAQAEVFAGSGAAACLYGPAQADGQGRLCPAAQRQRWTARRSGPRWRRESMERVETVGRLLALMNAAGPWSNVLPAARGLHKAVEAGQAVRARTAGCADASGGVAGRVSDLPDRARSVAALRGARMPKAAAGRVQRAGGA